jgi:hypothetical protein
MTPSTALWPEVFGPNTRVLVIVNSVVSQMQEIASVMDALDARCGLANVSVIAPVSIRRWLIGRGVMAARLLSFELEIFYFLQSERATQWGVRQRADFVVGTEPYALNNEEVKGDFELRAALLVGAGRFVVHSLPAERVFLLPVEDLWRRAARAEAASRHQARVRRALDRLYDLWRRDGAGTDADVRAVTAEALAVPEEDESAMPPLSVLDACRFSYERLHAATLNDGAYPASPIRVLLDPPHTMPRAGWLTARVKPVRRPALVADRVRWRAVRLAYRGEVEGPYSYLLQSKPVSLKTGDAAIAEGHVHQGGITIGLVKDGRWASHVDVVDRGPFLAAAVAVEPGAHALVVANCLHGAGRRTGVILRRFGWAHQDA